MGKAFWLLLVLVLFALVVQSAHAEIEIGKPAPALSVKEFDGTDFDLKTLKGKVVVINFWATWCGPCREELPELSAFNHDYSGQGVAVIGLSVDTRHRKGEAIEVAKAFRVPAAMLDETKTSGFDVPPYIPVTYVIDKKGIVAARLLPNEKPVTEENLGDIVKPLLEADDKAAAPAPATPATPAADAAKPAEDAKPSTDEPKQP